MPLEPYLEPGRIEVGIDESGRGCLAGRVYAAAAILPIIDGRQGLPPDLACEVNDSKKLSKAKRDYLRKRLEVELADYAVAWAEPEEVDALNILQATYLAMYRALNKLKSEVDHIIVDGNRFVTYEYFGKRYPHTTIVGGDAKYLSIASASILAKEYHDQHVKQMLAAEPELEKWGWANNMCYGTKQHRDAIQQWGLSPYHRKTFRSKQT